MSNGDGILKLFKQLERKDNLSHSESDIANFILANPNDTLNMSIYDLAERTLSSTSTIVRLCKKLGFSGFKELKVQLAYSIANHKEKENFIDFNTPFLSSDSEIDIAKKIATVSTEAIIETQALLNQKDLSHATHLLVNATNILGIGVSECFIRLNVFKSKLLKINKYIKLVDLQAEQFFLASYSNKNDVAILVSYSGETAEIVNDAKILHKNGAKIIAITSSLQNTLSNLSDVTLLIPNDEQTQNNFSNFSSQISIEYVLNVLYSCLYKQNYKNNYYFSKKTPKSSF